MLKRLLLASILLLAWRELVFAQFPEDPNRKLPANYNIVNPQPLFQLPVYSSDPGLCTIGAKYFNSGSLLERTCTSPNSWANSGVGLVTSVFGRVGDVVPQTSDYSFSQIAGSVAVSQLDPTVALWSSGAGAPSATCNAGQQFYLDTTNFDPWFCSATNTWRKILSTPNSGVSFINMTNGADPCGTPAVNQDCVYVNASDVLVVKSHAGTNQTIVSSTTTAGGDLSGTFPNPTVAKVNGVAYAASPANHTIAVITAANTATAKTVPDCQDSAGNHINYTQSTDSFSCGTTNSGGNSPGATGTFFISDEFVGGLTSSGSIGSIGWLMTTITAAPTSLQEPGTWPNLGVIRCTTAAAAQGDGCAFNLGANSIGPVGDLSTNTNWDSTWIFRIGQTTTTRLRIGFEAGNSLITQSTDGFWARYDTNASFADTTFQLCARTTSGTEACFNTTVAADTNFHKVRIRSTVANKILMTFDAGAEKSFCAASCDVTVTPSTVAMTPMMTITTDTTAAKFAEVDYFAMQMTGLTR